MSKVVFKGRKNFIKFYNFIKNVILFDVRIIIRRNGGSKISSSARFKARREFRRKTQHDVANFLESLKFERQRESFNSHFSMMKCTACLVSNYKGTL